MGAERRGSSLKRAAAGMTVLAVGCRHVGCDWLQCRVEWEKAASGLMSHGLDSSQSPAIRGTRCEWWYRSRSRSH